MGILKTGMIRPRTAVDMLEISIYQLFIVGYDPAGL